MSSREIVFRLNAYCWQQTGQSLKDFSAQLMTESAQEADGLEKQAGQNHRLEMAM